MLQITVPDREWFDNNTQQFYSLKGGVLKLEHSLLSISKWESKWHKPFLNRDAKDTKTNEELYDYVRCMSIVPNVSMELILGLTEENLKDIFAYIDNPMTASYVHERKSQTHGEVLTSELLYYYMISLGIPFECEKWHLNRLIMLIKICSVKNNPRKMSRSEILAQNHALNQARRKRLGSKG